MPGAPAPSLVGAGVFEVDSAMPLPKLVRIALAAATLGLASGLVAPPAGAESPSARPALQGTDVHFDYDGHDVGRPERAWLGRAFVHQLVATDATRPRPMLVFMHGTNAALIKYRWMGGGAEGDVRRIVAELMETGQIEPIIVAGPSAILPSVVVNARNIWPSFDLDLFVQLASEELRGVATVDRSRVIVVAHSGGGCNPNGGIASAVQGRLVPMAALAVDACMDVDVAQLLARARPENACRGQLANPRLVESPVRRVRQIVPPRGRARGLWRRRAARARPYDRTRAHAARCHGSSHVAQMAATAAEPRHQRRSRGRGRRRVSAYSERSLSPSSEVYPTMRSVTVPCSSRM